MKNETAERPRRRKRGSAKRLAAILGAVLFIAGCIPVRLSFFDGGTVSYEAVLWGVTNKHRIACDKELGWGYNTGTEVRVLFFTVYDSDRFEPRYPQTGE